MDEILSAVNAEPEVNVEPQIEQVNTEPVNAGVEPATPSVEKPVQTAEDNARFAAIRREAEAKAEQRIKEATEKARREAAQEARDSWIAEQGYEWKGKSIKTEAEYKQALKEKELEEKIHSQYSNVPDEIVNELLEGKRFRDQYQTEQQEKERKTAEEKAKAEHNAKIQRECAEFDKLFKEENGQAFDWVNGKFPVEVEKMVVDQGYSLDYAYSRYLLDSKRSAQQTQQANQANSAASTGSAKAGGVQHDVINEETINTHANDTVWMMRNFNRVEEFYKKKGR
jgi:hypothetical protein